MWTTGELSLLQKNGKRVTVYYWVKHFEEPSDYGINKGRISKLSIKVNGQTTANYDRGWDIKPKDEISRKALKIIMKEYN